MNEELEAAAAALPIADPLSHEPPRSGEPGGEPCHYCATSDSDALWASSRWRALPRGWSPIPGGTLLISKAHVDTLSDLPAEQQAEFGVIAAAIERAIMGLGQAARVHMYRWGDGCAHFHAHFIARPLGRPQFAWRNLPFLEKRFPSPGAEQLAQARKTVAESLAADLPA